MQIPNTFKGLKLQVLDHNIMYVGTWVMSLSMIENRSQLLEAAKNDKCVPGNIIVIGYKYGAIPGRLYPRYYYDHTGQLEDQVNLNKQ